MTGCQRLKGLTGRGKNLSTTGEFLEALPLSSTQFPLFMALYRVPKEIVRNWSGESALL